MEYRQLGNTGITVSRLCFGTLTMGPFQRNLSVDYGKALLEQAFSCGVNFLDTAEIYGTYPYVKEALKSKPDAVVCTKSYSYDKKTAEQSLEKAMREIGRDYIDVYLLHEQESQHTIRGHREAIEYFLEMKQKGYIGAFGLSTHFIQCVKDTLRYPEIEVVFPLINITGVGIADGSADEMLNAIKAARANGKAIFAMKPLGGGHLISSREEALNYIMAQDCIDSIAMGMQSPAEVEYNCALFSNQAPSQATANAISMQPRELIVQDWCEGCGRCVERCKAKAMRLIDGKAVVDKEKCVFCGYCAGTCPQFCIKVI